MILLEQSFTAQVRFLVAISAFG